MLEHENPEEVTLSPPEAYEAFQGAKAGRAVWITWHSDKNRKSHETLLRVVEDGPFDLVIGSELLFKEGIFEFHEAALLFFHRKARTGE